MNDGRIRLAERFLQEAVYRSRARQAAGVGLAGGELDKPSTPANCGLGESAAIELGLEGEGAELFHRLWPEPPSAEGLERIQRVMADWLTLQDALDRKRNHFLRDFRAANGVDRTAYGAEELASYESGLAAINDEVNARQRRSAGELLGEE